MKKALKALLKGAAFLLIFCVLLSLVMCVLLFKQEDGTLPMRNYYELPPDTVDALFLGSSHIGMNLSTQILWDEYGIAGYKCWGSTQPIWNTYYYLKECLKSQTPRVVVVDVHGAIFSYDYADYALQVKNTMGMRFSRDKIEAVMASAPRDKWADLLLELPAFHTRYNELTEKDFDYFPWNRHTDINVLVNQSQSIVFPFDILDKDATEGVEPLAWKEEKYLRAIIELCREKNVPLELIAAPYQLSEFEQRRFRAVGELVKEYDGLRFTNYNDLYREYGIDPRHDFLDPGHFNSDGVPKYTRVVAEMLKKDHDLPDRRLYPGHVWNTRNDITQEPAYALDRQFAGDGHQNYVDTGYVLFHNPLSSWTLFCEFQVPSLDVWDKVIFSCYDETEGNFSGLLVNIDKNDLLTVRFSSYENIQTDPVWEGQRIRLAVVKNYKTVEVYCDGTRLGGFELQQLSGYTGTLLLGCQRAADGTLFRYSQPLIFDLQVFDTLLSENQIKSWTPRDLPVPPVKEYVKVPVEPDQMVYALDYRFMGDGQEAYLDTGVQLYENPDVSWTLLSRIDPRTNPGDTVYFSCFMEDVSNYRGILVRMPDPGRLNIVYGHASQLNVDIPLDRVSTLAIVKDRAAYTVYLNGETVLDAVPSPCDAYGGTLLLGCEAMADGTLFRYSGTVVENLEIISGIMKPENVTAWQPVSLSDAPRPQPSSVEYAMETGLAGNGKSNYVDTGIQLYDVRDKNWALHLVIDFDPDAYGTAVCCFAEDAGDYRGLLVRQTDQTTYGLTLGTAFGSVSVDESRVQVFDILKEGYHYTVYVNGEKKLELDSRAKTWDGTLFVGAERMLNGTPFRFSTQKIRRLTVTENLPAETQIRQNVKKDMNSTYFQK